MSKKYFIHSTAAGCTSNLWESAVYDDYFKTQGMERVHKANDADILVVNTCAVTPGFEDQSEKYINKMIKTQLGPDAEDKKLVIAGCYSAIRTEKIEANYKQGDQVSHIKPVEMEKLANSLGIPFEKSYKPIETNHFDGINHCDSSLAHKIVWYVRKLVHTAYGILRIEKSYLLNFLDAMIFNEQFFVIDVGHGCAGGCSFCSIKQSRGFIKSEGESVILKNVKRGLSEGRKDFWLLATDIGAWGLDRNQNPGDLLEPIYSLKDDFRVVLNYLEPRWLLHHESLHKFLKDNRTIGVAVPIQSGSTRLVYHSGRRYDPKIVADCVMAIKEKNPHLIVKTDIIVGLPTETWHDFFDSVKAVFKFDVVVPVVFGVRPGTRAEKDDEHISLPIKWLRMGILSSVAISWQAYLCGSALIGDLLKALSPNAAKQLGIQQNIN
ncbi:MAG: radical SAM protein [Bacteriovoracia bacterium]